MATAHRLVKSGMKVTVFEKSSRLGAGQSGHNSNVVHSGAFYVPGSLKARLASRGREMLEEFIAQNDLPFARVGKLVVKMPGEDKLFAELVDRAASNGVESVVLESLGELREFEPLVTGIAALSGCHALPSLISSPCFTHWVARFKRPGVDSGSEPVFGWMETPSLWTARGRGISWLRPARASTRSAETRHGEWLASRVPIASCAARSVRPLVYGVPVTPATRSWGSTSHRTFPAMRRSVRPPHFTDLSLPAGPHC